jgi:HAMP domain-containing protein
MKLIMENWRKYNNDPFQLLCERYNKKLITEKQLFEQWQQNTSEELEQLLLEIDWEKEAGKVEDPDYKPPHERKGMLAKGWEKINDWILQKSIQIVELAKAGGMKALKSIAWLVKKIQSFCGKYKAICKIAVATLTVVALFVIFANITEAQAAIEYKGQPLDDTKINVIKGMARDLVLDPGTRGGIKLPFSEDGIKLLAKIDELHNAEGMHDFMKGKGEVDALLRKVVGAYQKAANFAFDPGAHENPEKWKKSLQTWHDLGSTIEAWYEESVKGGAKVFKGSLGPDHPTITTRATRTGGF